MLGRGRPPNGLALPMLFAGIGVVLGVGLVVLVVNPLSSPGVTVGGVSFQIVQGTSTDGLPWFGVSTVNLSGARSGYPIQIAPHGTFTVAVILVNGDLSNHTVYSVTIGSPFTVLSVDPVLPIQLDSHEDLTLFFVIQVNASPGSTVFGQGTINTLG